MDLMEILVMSTRKERDEMIQCREAAYFVAIRDCWEAMDCSLKHWTRH